MCWHSQTLRIFNYTIMQVFFLGFSCSIFVICVFIMFCYCYYGGRTTEQFMEIADTVFESKWHQFPINLRKFIFLTIVDAQKPIYCHGFYIVDLDLITFTRVSLFPCNFENFPSKCIYGLEYLQGFKTIISYYMMFKKFALK